MQDELGLSWLSYGRRVRFDSEVCNFGGSVGVLVARFRGKEGDRVRFSDRPLKIGKPFVALWKAAGYGLPGRFANPCDVMS